MQVSSPRADLSCLACRRLKRRCDRKTPCALCSRVGRACTYPSPESTPRGPRSGSSDETNIQVTSQPICRSQPHPRPGLPAAFFLDSVASRGVVPTLRNSLEWEHVGTDVPGLTVSEAREIAKVHFETTHCWFGIISKVRLDRRLVDNGPINGADTTAMLYAMQLLAEPESSTHEVYQAVKAALAHCESYGQLSLEFLAANILIAVHELSQAIFPAAYLTVAMCSRLCYSMGWHDKRKATQLLPKPDTWIEVEERRRLWWAVLLLDRYTHLGLRFRPLATLPIPSDEIIPAGDESWDIGEMAVNPLLVMSMTAAAPVAPFARTCQAAHLLGRACQHVNEHPSAEDADLHFQEAWQISKAAQALSTIINDESSASESPDRFYAGRALCYSALMLLYDVHSCVEVDEVEACGGNRGLRLDLQQLAIDGSKELAYQVHSFAMELEQAHTINRGCLSPLVMYCLYSASGTFAWYVRESGDEKRLRCLNDLRRVLGLLQEKWQTAGELHSALRKENIADLIVSSRVFEPPRGDGIHV
ncbi:hypothetical protein M409DRAFT_51378 [Zasmidium cellare ATCC 36951]|uniref:Zn(2)-C6 fungal-type domain-containing protein n=1 Tax=Zasmidium cellare ATCC 36951 TaxID=1080233 RepID=A0A6A6CWY0_ZASCE|nr:uncharacterized protein M409DRAFT_51378 [Zasmidium cellare ATCC 36951]KAF2170319.1 hypothetical protein M409DRAFT_51378 [Zasmidium cellare ATCC 36951]